MLRNSKINVLEWHDQIVSVLTDEEIICRIYNENSFSLIVLDDYKIIINLLDINNNFKAQELINIQVEYQKQDIRIIHLWEDVWYTKSSQVLARIKSLAGLNKRIHGRKTKVLKLIKSDADFFVNENHLQGAVSSRYKFGLFLGNDLVAVATFSALRKMNHTDCYKSAELIRFAVKAGFNVSGGLSKLIKHFVKLLNPNDIMTYADKDWSAGEAYHRLGFCEVDVIQPQQFILDEKFKRRLNKECDADIRAKKVFNTGSIKFILKF